MYLLLLVLSLVSALVGFAVSHRVLKSRPVSVRLAVFPVFIVLAMPAVMFAVYYLHVLPEWAWFYTIRSWPGTETLSIFLGAAGGTMATLLPRWLLVLPLFGTLVAASIPSIKPLYHPVDRSLLNDRWYDDVCFQSTASTCGPASVANILHFLRHPASEREIALAAHTSATGTEAWYLARYLRTRGLHGRFDFHETFSPTVPLPAMVGIKIYGRGHFIAVLKISGDTVTYIDPMHGKQEVPLVDFTRSHDFTGFHMTVK